MNTKTPKHLPRVRILPWLLAGSLIAGSAWAAAASSAANSPPALLLANRDIPDVDVSHYLVSEKLDGVRAYWDGSSLRFRSGRLVPAPRWFIERLPAAHALDGELWLGRGRFDAVSALVRSESADDSGWLAVRYMVFELPGAAGSFADRSRKISAIVRDTGWDQLQAVQQFSLANRAELLRKLDHTIADGGEGLMLHLAAAPYTTGRSDVLVKLKSALDTEAVVVGHRPGRGKFGGAMGALQVQTPDGRRFWLGTGFSEPQRRNPPPVGSVITYRYRDLTSSGLPRFASFVRVHDGF